VYAAIRAILDSLLAWVHRLVERKGQASDAPRDPDMLRRAGARIREWMHPSGTREREQSDQNGT